MESLIFMTFKQLVVAAVAIIGLLLLGIFLIIRIWARNRFKAIEDRTESLEQLREKPVEDSWFIKHG